MAIRVVDSNLVDMEISAVAEEEEGLGIIVMVFFLSSLKIMRKYIILIHPIQLRSKPEAQLLTRYPDGGRNFDNGGSYGGSRDSYGRGAGREGGGRGSGGFDRGREGGRYNDNGGNRGPPISSGPPLPDSVPIPPNGAETKTVSLGFLKVSDNC